MSKYKTEQYVSEQLNKIWEQTRECEAFSLGMASGYYQFYKYYRDEVGEDVANKSFKSVLNGADKYSEHFRKLVALDNERDSEVDKIMNKLKECLKKE